MAELVISALLPLLLEKLASAALKRIARDKGVKAEINKWEKSLKRIKDVLANASRHEDPDDPVKQWLNDLQHLAYDIDDLLDGWETEARQREFTDDSEAITVKVRKLITPTCCTNFSWTTTMLAELDHISTKLQDLVMERDNLGLIVENVTRPRNVNRRLQGSMVHAPSIIGREKKKKALVKELLAADSEPCNQNFSIVPIVGLGGVGKTTLARLLYNEKKVNDHFQLKAWVCVSDEFNSFGISKVIFQSVAGIHKKFADLNLLQIELSNHLREKKFLLVLDDVWSENYEDWETLVRPFHACAPGSRIIMTTRKEQLLRKLGYNNLDQLECLQHEDALSLVAQHALGVNNFHSHLSLEPYGRGIVEKCGGLPLALIALGRLLRTKKNEEEYWKEVLDSEIWTLEDGGGVLALRLSYNDLSPHLKHLFAYCSLFPKGFRFDKDELVVLWMAEGFLNKSTSNKQIELLGHDYFDELLLRSFFQHAPDNKSLFVMHDLINDLATSIAGEFFVRFDNETENRIQEQALEKYRHMSFVREEYVTYKKFDTFKRFKSSRTFLALEKSCQRSFLPNNILVDLLPKLPLLRVLSLSDFHISEVPESIGTLRHLRYLNLSRTQIEHLPESVCNLYNLETLIFFGCSRLTEFPKSFYKLKNLRHLDIRDTQRLHHMPLGIGEMKSLQTLTKIIIEGESGFEITEVKELKNLCGKISIVGLDKVQNAIHARQANFSKKMITELEVEWSQMWDGSRNEMLEKEVMDELKPCDKYLKKLKIGSYGGLEFPIWVGDPSFHQLKLVSIRGCKKCTSLPPLGQLPSLKELFIEGLEGVTVVGMELLGTGLPFPSLEILCFKDMPGWGKWSTDSGVVFPRLRHLRIRNCPNLVEVSLEALPSLNHLEIIECDSSVLRKVVKVASSVNILMLKLITGLDDVVLRGITGYLGKVEELIIQECNEIRYLWESEALAGKDFVNLRKLKVDRCEKLLSLGEKEEGSCWGNFLTSLTKLDVCNCENMVSCCCPVNIDTLIVYKCISMTAISLPKADQKLKSLYISGCIKLPEREWRGDKILNNTRSMRMLDYIDICDWSNLKSITELNILVHLTTLKIINCESLESFPHNELSSLTSLKFVHITNCPSMDACFPCGVWPPKLHSLTIGKLKKPISEWGPQNFPTSTVELYLHGDDGVVSSSQFANFLPSSITHLEIIAFENLESFSMGLQRLNSVQHLTCFKCPNLMDLPKALLHSFLSLKVLDCPKLEERCSKRGSYWHHISRIPYIRTQHARNHEVDMKT